jgi:hypothetical protein
MLICNAQATLGTIVNVQCTHLRVQSQPLGPHLLTTVEPRISGQRALRQGVAHLATMQQMPSEVLRMVWDLLRDDGHEEGLLPSRQWDQHALRCTSTAMREASNDWIDSLVVCAARTFDMKEAAEGLSQQLWAKYPHAAKVTSLVWYQTSDPHVHDAHTSILRRVLQEPTTAQRLSCLHKICLHVTVSAS